MNKKHKLALSCLVALMLSPLAAQPADKLSAVVDGLAESYYLPKVRAAFGTFTFEYSGLPTPFARWLEDSLALAAVSSARLELLNKSAAAALDPAFRAEYGDFLESTGTQALLHGRYFPEGGVVRVHLELTDLSTGTLIGAGDWRVEEARIPAYASVAPAASAQERARELSRLGFQAPEGLKVSISTDRGPGAAYRDGESMEVLVGVNKSCYVRLYHVDSSGNIQLVWPNRFGGGDGRVEGGQTVRIPGSQPFRFLLHEPYGTEFIKAVASTTPFSGSVDDFSDLGTSVRGVLTRGLTVSGGTAPEAAEALASYSIGPAN
jgi:hypothetical protein